jgi:hydrogenase maturation protease
MKRILIVGLGNILLQDEGVGMHVLDRLREEVGLPNTVELVYGETSGLALLPVLDTATAIIFVDAMEFDGAAGETKILRGDEILGANNALISMHEVGLREVVSLISLMKDTPPEIVLVGIQPKELGAGLQLSPEVKSSIPEVVGIIKREVEKFVI